MEILLVEDDRDYARFVEALLASSASLECGITHAPALGPALAAIDAGGIDLVLLDLVLPDSEGLDTFARVHARARQTPIIVLTGNSDDRMAARAMRDGAQDYLIKSDVTPDLLARAIRYAFERKRAEEMTRRSERHFRLLIENALDIITIVDYDGIVRFGSPSMERVLGYGSAELLGSSALELVHPDSLTRARHALRAARRGRSGVQALELRVRDRLGEWRSLEIVARALPADACIAGVVVNARDVTERRRAQEALHASEQRFRELFENANDAIFTCDLTGHFTSLNHAGERLLGYSRSEISTIHLSWVVSPNDLPRVREMIAAKVEGRVRHTVYEIDLITKDGTRVPVEISSRAICQDGQPIGIQATARDITGRRRIGERPREAGGLTSAPR